MALGVAEPLKQIFVRPRSVGVDLGFDPINFPSFCEDFIKSRILNAYAQEWLPS